jgi:hypothetical protein
MVHERIFAQTPMPCRVGHSLGGNCLGLVPWHDAAGGWP